VIQYDVPGFETSSNPGWQKERLQVSIDQKARFDLNLPAEFAEYMVGDTGPCCDIVGISE
jgi:hypothetical protein